MLELEASRVAMRCALPKTFLVAPRREVVTSHFLSMSLVERLSKESLEAMSFEIILEEPQNRMVFSTVVLEDILEELLEITSGDQSNLKRYLKKAFRDA